MEVLSMIDYNNLNLTEVLNDFQLYFDGKISKKDVLEKHGLNYYSYKYILKMIQDNEDASTNCKAEIDTV